MDSFDKWLNYKRQQEAAEVGNEMGNELAEMGEQLVRAFPRLSALIGVSTGIITFIYGINHWHFKTITLILLSLLAGAVGTYFGLVFIGLAMLVTVLVIAINFLF